MAELKKRKLEEVDNSDVSEETLRSLLEPLAKPQLIDLLAKLGSKYSYIAEEIMNTASGDRVHRRLFVRGLAWNTSSEKLCAAFEVHGEIEEGAVIHDKITGICRGFGFITYKNIKSAQEALRESSKLIDGRLAVCNLACEGISSATITPDQAQRKLYIGGLSPETTTEILLSFFSRHGELLEGSVAYDKDTNSCRGFGFVTYKTLEATKKALNDTERILGGCNITVKYADKKSRTTPNQQPQAPVLVTSPMVAPPPLVSTRNMKSAQEALESSSKYIDGRLTECNLACEGLSSANITPDQAQRKLYIGGLSPETTTEILLSFFRRHGEIVEGSVLYDKDTNRSRCFGFVTYKTLEATKKALDDTDRILGGCNITVKYADTKSKTTPNQQPQAPVLVTSPMVAPPPLVSTRNMKSAQEALGASSKYIDGRLTECNLACEGLSSANITPDPAQRKLYIWGLSPETTTEMFLSFFSRHGEIVEGSVVYDKNTNRSRGFGFVTYKMLEATKKALDDTDRILGSLEKKSQFNASLTMTRVAIAFRLLV
ncbi:uncharacterized protein LOC141642170 isoform X2 [Silene latifolia]|uniref:uncharacterized protein LOC141642170 isoform X2 n=1 Tax=Silene latifolia TaxID=37657 RepID=UPI003D788904